MSDTVINDFLCPKCGGLVVQMYYSLSVDGTSTANFECVNGHEWNTCNPENTQVKTVSFITREEVLVGSYECFLNRIPSSQELERGIVHIVHPVHRYTSVELMIMTNDRVVQGVTKDGDITDHSEIIRCDGTATTFHCNRIISDTTILTICYTEAIKYLTDRHISIEQFKKRFGGGCNEIEEDVDAMQRRLTRENLRKVFG